MKKLLVLLPLISTSTCFADISGFLLGGGLGYGIQQQSYQNNNVENSSLAYRIQFGYQIADWMGVELGYNYISQSSNWQNLGSPSSTIYDLSITPGFTIPATPIGIFARLGVAAVSTNLNSNMFNQSINSSANFEYGAGVKVSIPFTRVFIRGEYINYGGGPNNGNPAILTTPSAIMIDAAYVF